MRKEFLLWGIHLFVWLYLLRCFWQGRTIEYLVDDFSQNAFWGFCSLGVVILFSSSFALEGIFSFISLMLAGVFYQKLPSGFSEKAVYLHGRKVAYHKIREWLWSEEKNLRLIFYCRMLVQTLQIDPVHKERVMAYRSIWNRIRH